jgi:flagellar hook-associated protein 1 FlgK
VQQEATALAGQNMANVNNPAYAEEQLDVQSATPLETPAGDEGTGVEAVSITSMRNALLDAQIAAEDSVTGSLNSQQTALQQAEAYLNEELSSSSSSSSTSATSPNGLTADFSNFFSSLQTLSTDPSNISDRQAVIQSAQELTEQFNQVSAGLSTVTSDLNTSVQSGVSAVNQDMTQIAALNQQIIATQTSGGTAEQLVDEREQLIEDAAGYMNLTTTAQPNGGVDVSIGSTALVTGDAVTNTLQTYTGSNGQLFVQTGAGTDVTLTSGSVAGSITSRDGAVATLQSSLNTLASQLITQVNTVYSGGYDLNGNNLQSEFFTGTDATDIGVNSTVVNDPSTFQAAAAAGEPGDNTVVLAMANLANTSLSGLDNQTLTQNYSNTVEAFGSALQSVNDQLSNSNSVAQMLSTQRASASGVNTDTEMTNLLQFQKAYEASAELISTVNEMLQTVISMTTQ